MASSQPDSAFLTRLPLEIRNEIYEIYTLKLLEKTAHDNASYKRSGYEYISTLMSGMVGNKTKRLCPPLLKTCKMVAREYTAAASKHALIIYETPVGDESCWLAMIRKVTIGGAKNAQLRHIRVVWKLAIQYVDDAPMPEVMYECTLERALGGSAPNLTTIQYEQFDIGARKTCDDMCVLTAMEDTLDYFLESAVKDHSPERLELIGRFREQWIDAVEKEHEQLQVRRGRLLDPEDKGTEDSVELCEPSH
ncbi:hypothetical protein Micbo1qcDRAFT_207382 [Microdochium bolleyi]|uniref:F-box domain-containing protein n=1 Tax=Microdochium bolleyi TaxID=196109 RepID=A0A136ITA4_9PEZI|nr:hypothetical protein Micbo1qcDRAFT_207382 [Microdochium bolleyi]